MIEDSEAELYTDAIRDRYIQEQMLCHQVAQWINTPPPALPPSHARRMSPTMFYAALACPPAMA